MEVLLSNQPIVQSLPESYVIPPERRPGKVTAPVGNDIPVIDLEKTEGPDRAETVQQIIQACQEFGLFQVINHGVPGELMDAAMKALNDFFNTPAEYKQTFITDARDKSCVLYTSALKYNQHQDGCRYWRDCFIHHCYPLEDHVQNWPANPPQYREAVGKYSVEVRKYLLRILNLLCEGLGLEEGYFAGDLSNTVLMSVNHHIPCPDPTMALGHAEHSDPNLITTLHQCAVPGLQVLKDGQWIGVPTIPHAFVVIPGVQFRVISNGKFSSPRHRVVTNAKEHRTTLGTFFVPSDDSMIEPSKALIDESTPQRFRSYRYKEFFNGWKGQITEDDALKQFELH